MEGPDTSLEIAPKALDGGNRHICAFFTDMDEHYRVLQSFIKDGFDQGDKTFNLIDPKRREDHLRRLADAGIDVEEATASGQLEVHPWEDGPLHGERFDQDTWLAGFEEVLQSGPAAGYAQTSFLGHMEWALLDFFCREHVKDGYTFLLPPHLLIEECGYAAGQFPKFVDDVFHVS